MALMPLKAGSGRATISQNIGELHQGKTYAQTATKFGKQKANAQAVVIALRQAGKSRIAARRPMKRSKTPRAGSILE
jgi:hypothetical protein